MAHSKQEPAGRNALIDGGLPAKHADDQN